MSRSQALTACVALGLLACSGCQAITIHANLSKDTRALFPIATPFGVGPNGHIDITVKDLQPWHRTGDNVPDPKLSRMGFFLTTQRLQTQTLQEYDLSRGPCPLEGDNVIVLFTLDHVVNHAVYEYKRDLRDIVQHYDGGEYGLFFANCEPQSAVSFDLKVSLSNADTDGKSDHVSIGDDMLYTMSTDLTASS